MSTALSAQQSVDHIRTVGGTVYFDAFHMNHIVPLPTFDDAVLIDVGVSAHGTPSPYITQPGIPFVSPVNVRLYLVGWLAETRWSADVTSGFITETRRSLDQQDQKRTVAQYSQALNAWLDMIVTDPILKPH